MARPGVLPAFAQSCGGGKRAPGYRHPRVHVRCAATGLGAGLAGVQAARRPPPPPARAGPREWGRLAADAPAAQLRAAAVFPAAACVLPGRRWHCSCNLLFAKWNCGVEGRWEAGTSPAALNGEVSRLRARQPRMGPPHPSRRRPARWRRGCVPLGGASLPHAWRLVQGQQPRSHNRAPAPACGLRELSQPSGHHRGGAGGGLWDCFEPPGPAERRPAGTPPSAPTDPAFWVVPGKAWGVEGAVPGIGGRVRSWGLSLPK